MQPKIHEEAAASRFEIQDVQFCDFATETDDSRMIKPVDSTIAGCFRKITGVILCNELLQFFTYTVLI